MAESPALKPVYLLTGSDRPKIETAARAAPPPLRAGGDRARQRPGASGAEAVALCNAGSLFGDGRLVLVEGVDGRRNSEGRLANGWKAADVKAIEAYLASPAPDTVLALVAEELKKDAPLTKACAKAGDVLAYDVAKRKADAWVAEHFKQAGVRAEPDAVAALVQLVGEDFHQLANEVDKLAPLGRRRADRGARGRAARRGRRGDADVRAHRRLGAARRRAARSPPARPSSSARDARAATRRREWPALSATTWRSCAAASGSRPRACGRATPPRP